MNTISMREDVAEALKTIVEELWNDDKIVVAHGNYFLGWADRILESIGVSYRVSDNDKYKILSVDFDGVLHSFNNGWKGATIIDCDPVPGAVNFMWSVVAEFNVIVFSSRATQAGGVQAIMEWLKKWGFPNVSICSEKPASVVHLDDRCMTFTGVFPSIEELKSFVPWNSK